MFVRCATSWPARLRAHVTSGGDLSEELIADRRAEAERE
jgi:hypothetical protein